MLRKRSFLLVLAVTLASLAVGAQACSSSRPPPAQEDPPKEAGGPGLNEAGTSFEGGDAEAGVLPASCFNTIRDDKETDIDCGGSVCGKCIDGKVCIAETDCAGGACFNKVCSTPACHDNLTSGDETDTDCGGLTCARCTIGKRCLATTDCLSAVCSQQLCRCPKGMIEVSRAGGNGAYCVDEIEVTKFQYNKFLTANVPITDQDAICAPPVNTNFVPRGAWPPAVAPPNYLSVGLGLAFNYSLAVHYVDWCDAFAYCKWAGKQLCGDVSGGAVDFAKADQADAGAWYNACSAQGQKQWPFGVIFEERCNGGQGLVYGENADAGGPVASSRNGYGVGGANQDEGIHQSNNGDLNGNYSEINFAQCQGGVTGLYHMTGNIAEWENACDGTAPTSNCRVRGGSYKSGPSNAAGLSCAVVRTEQRIPPVATPDPLADIGFRCCLY